MTGENSAPALPHLTAEFFVWLWYASERDGGSMNLGAAGMCDVWVEERLSFRIPDEDKARAVLTGENTSSAPEARAALASLDDALACDDADASSLERARIARDRLAFDI